MLLISGGRDGIGFFQILLDYISLIFEISIGTRKRMHTVAI